MSASEIASFFRAYRAAFARYDADALVGLFAFPLHVVGDGEEVKPTTVARDDVWLGVLERLLGAYRTLGVADAEPLEIAVTELTARVAVAQVHWELRRTDGSAVYDFTGVYTLVLLGPAWAVTAIAHDELPKLQAALGAP